jgi:hypothetical protein
MQKLGVFSTSYLILFLAKQCGRNHLFSNIEGCKADAMTDKFNFQKNLSSAGEKIFDAQNLRYLQ